MKTLFNAIGNIPLSEFLKPKMLFLAFCLSVLMIIAQIVCNENNRNVVMKKYEQYKNK
jgi:hypothetical protein